MIFQKESNDTIVFKNYPLKVEGEIRVDNVRALGLDIDERNIISGSGTQFKGKIKEMKAGIEIIGSVSISQIEKTANSLSDTFVKKNLETENQIIEARNQVKQFQKHLMKNPKEGQKNLNNAIKAMAEATTNINDIIGIKYNK